MLQQRIRNQVVVVLDLRLAEIDVKTQRLQCGRRRRQCQKGFFLTVNRFSAQLGCMCARTVGGLCASADLLAEHEGEVVLSLLMMSEVFETQSLQEAQQTLIIYRKLIP